MDCKEFRERLDPYVDGELTSEEMAGARAHLKGCAPCSKAEAGLRHLRSSLKRVVNRHQPPPELELKVLRSLSSRERGARVPAGKALDGSRRDVTPVWRAQVVVPAPFFALLVLSLVALAGWLIFARRTGGEEISKGRPATVATPAPPAEASGDFDFSRYYRGERASIQVVRRAALEGSRQ